MEDRVETSLEQLREACGAIGLGEDRGTQLYEHLKANPKPPAEAHPEEDKGEDHPQRAAPKKPG